jgi:hypothetical protein
MLNVPRKSRSRNVGNGKGDDPAGKAIFDEEETSAGPINGNPRGFSGLLRDIVLGGHLAVLKENELKVLATKIVLQELTDKRVAFASHSKVAKLIGHRNARNVQRATESLKARGYIETISQGGGKETAVQRVRIPAAKLTDTVDLADTAGLIDAANSAIGQIEHPPTAGLTVPPSAKLTVQLEQGIKNKDKNNGAASPSTHAQTIKIFCDAWQAKYGRTYQFARAKDAAHVKSILKASGDDVGKATGIIKRYLDDDEAFNQKNSHALGTLISRINSYTGDAPKPRQPINGNGHGPASSRRNALAGSAAAHSEDR